MIIKKRDIKINYLYGFTCWQEPSRGTKCRYYSADICGKDTILHIDYDSSWVHLFSIDYTLDGKLKFFDVKKPSLDGVKEAIIELAKILGDRIINPYQLNDKPGLASEKPSKQG